MNNANKKIFLALVLIICWSYSYGLGFRTPMESLVTNCNASNGTIISTLNNSYMTAASPDSKKFSNIFGVTTDISNYTTDFVNGIQYSPSNTTISYVQFAGAANSKVASILGGSRIYAIAPQVVFSQDSLFGRINNSLFCASFWLYNVRNDYNFRFVDITNSAQSFMCTANDVASLVVADVILYFALDCPSPPAAGRYQLYIDTTIHLDTYFKLTNTTTNTYPQKLQSSQTNQEFPDAVRINFAQIHTPFVTSINAVEGVTTETLNITSVTGLASTTGITGSTLLNKNIPPTYVCALPSTPRALIYNKDSSYTCQPVSNISGGLYNYTQQSNRGYAYNLPKTSYYNFDQDISYNLAIHPVINSISPSSGFSKGQRVTLAGEGFPPQTSQVNVSFAGTTCDVKSSSFNSITCELNPINVGSAGLSGNSFGSSGLILEKFQGYSQSLGALAQDTTTSATSRSIVQTPETLYTTQSGFFQRFTTYFIAPQSGTYRFSVAANGATSVYIASSGVVAGAVVGLSGIQPDRSTLRFVADNTNSLRYRDFSTALNISTMTSSNVTLTKGEAYMLTIVQNSMLPNTFMTLAVEIPSLIVNANSIKTVQTINIGYNYTPATLYRSTCWTATVGYSWTPNFYTGNITFALYQFKTPNTLTNLAKGLTEASNFAYTSKYDLNNPNTIALSQELTFLAEGRRINVTKIPSCSGTNSTNGFKCLPLGNCITGNINQSGWGFNITFLDPMPSWWYTAQNNLVELFSQFSLSGATVSSDLRSTVSGNFLGNYYLGSLSTTLTTYTTPTWWGGYTGNKILQGTWNFTYNNINSGNLSYDIDGSELRDVFRSKFGLFVTVSTSGWAESGYKWQITFDGVAGDTPMIVTNSQGLSVFGGTTADTVNITVSKNQVGRTNVFLAPIPTEMLRVQENNPEFIVYTGGVRSHKNSGANINYNVLESPTITGGEINSNMINFTVNYPATSPTPSNPTELLVTVNGINCTVTQFSSAGFLCAYTGSAPISPGPVNVTAFWTSYGYYDVVSPLLLVNTPSASVTGISPTSVSQTGGTVISIFGSGFGSLQNTFVSLLGVPAQVTYVSSVEIRFVCPNLTSTGAPGTTPIDINTNTINLIANGLFTYLSTAPTIVSLNVTSITPVKTSYISGTLSNNFDTTLSHYTASLIATDSSGNPNIPCYLFVMQGNSFICAVAGGKPGAYRFVLKHQTYGDSNQSPAILVQILAASISPSSGSFLGGTQITIQGDNFSPVLNENQIYIGDDLNNAICTVTSASKTQLTCTVGGLRGDQVPNTPYPVRVFGRLQQEANYSNTLSFTYLDVGATVTSVNTTIVMTGEILELVGQGLLSNNGNGVMVSLNWTNCPVTFSNESVIQCRVPHLIASDYIFSVHIPNKGYAITDGVSVFVPLAINGILSPVANAQGNRFVIEGNGFSNPSVEVAETNTSCVLVSATTTQIVCDVLTLFTQSQFYTLAVSFPGSAPQLLSFIVDLNRTPIVTSVSAFTNSITTTLTISGNNFTEFGGNLRIFLTSSSDQFEGTVSLVSNTSFLADFTHLPAVTYSIQVLLEGVGFATHQAAARTVTISLQVPASHPAQISFAGKSSLTYSGNGFQPNPTSNDVRVCGLPAIVTSSSYSSITFNVPDIVTPSSQSTYTIAQSRRIWAPKTFASNSTGISSLINDHDYRFAYNDVMSTCQVGLDFGEGTYVEIDSIIIYPDSTLSNPVALAGAKILGGNTTSTYTTLVTLDSTVQVGSNTYSIVGKPKYRYVVFSGAYCRIAELVVNGIHYAANPHLVTSTACNLDFYVEGSLLASLPNEITATQSSTMTVTGVTPTEGPSAGGTQITITGTNFGSDASKLSVKVNNIDCLNLNVAGAGTQITCTTGYAANYPSTTRFDVIHVDHGDALIQTTPFSYEDRWSVYATWGQLPPPTAGQIVYVPSGQRLIFDSTIQVTVVGFLIEGTIIFEDTHDYEINANWILIKGGSLLIGSETQPFQHNVRITLTGETRDVQIPTYGNKVFAIRGGTVKIYGQPKTSWTRLTTSVLANDNQISVVDSTGWRVGDQIVISSTDFEHDHYETATIVSIAGNIITLDTLLSFSHYANIETYSSGQVNIAAEVGVLTRNIVIQGDDLSEHYSYGAHVLISQYGVAAIALFQNVEFYRVGQRGQKDRFPLNFVQIFDAPDSGLVDCSIHRSYNRGVRVLQTKYLEFQRNVLFDIVGHGFYLESSTETFNNFDRNLVLGVKSNHFFQTTDITPAAFYITNPQNYFSNNVAAGSEYYGFAFSIKNNQVNSDYYISLANVCPQGTRLGLFTNNIAHSNAYEGLWIWPEFIPRANPCGGNNWDYNTPITADFSGFLAYKHAIRAIYLYSIGDVRFQNLVLIDNSNEGIFIHYAGNSPDNTSQINNSLIVAYSQGNAQGVYNSKGISVPASENFVVSNVVFENFDQLTMAALTTCSGWCHDGPARTIRVFGLSFVNVLTRLRWRSTAIFKTEDTSLSGTVGWSVPYQKHNLESSSCMNDTSLQQTITCNASVTVRRIKITPSGANFWAQTLRVLTLGGSASYLTAQTTDYTDIPYDHTTGAFTAPYVLGYRYHTHWNNGSDFSRAVVSIENLRYRNSDPFAILEFNYTSTRELFDMYVGGKLSPQFPNGTLMTTSNSSLLMGNYTHDNDTTLLRVAVNYANNMSSADIRPIVCRYTCPPPPPAIVTDGRIRYWSNPSDWDTIGAVPVDGDEVIIPSTWLMILDTDTAQLARLEINGILKVLDPLLDNGQPFVSINAYNIWIHGGLLEAGSEQYPYTGNFAINLLGDQTNQYLVIDAIADSGPKIFAVTGNLSLYGKPLPATQASLVNTAQASTSLLELDDATSLALVAGDILVIGPTGFDAQETDIVTVVAVNGNQVVLSTPLRYSHFGSNLNPTSNSNFNLDLSAKVGKLNRNIKISGGSSIWGGRIYVTESTQYRFDSLANNFVPITLAGSAILSSVELINLGQNDYHAGVHFDAVSNKSSTVHGSSMHGLGNWGIYVYNSTNVTIDGNMIVNPGRHAIAVEDGSSNKITNNLVVGTYDSALLNGDIIDLVASIYSTSSTTVIHGNTVSGSEGIGYLVVADTCDTSPTYVGSNKANSVNTGVIVTSSQSGGCILLQNFQVFHANNGGINTYIAAHELRASNLVLTDNIYGSLNLNLGGSGDLAFAKITLSNSYIGGTTFKMLENSYACSNISGIRIPVATIGANSIPYRTWQQPFWSIYNDALFATLFEVSQVELANFQDGMCSGLFAFETNPTAADASAVTTISGLTLTNVDSNKFINFSYANPDWIKDFICGNFQCTGLSNVLIKDLTGIFGNSPGSYLPNTSGIALSGPNTLTYGSAFWSPSSYGVISFDSQDSDNFSRLFSPIAVIPYGTLSNYTNTLNSFRDHQHFYNNQTVFQGIKRLSRFAAVVPDNASYNLAFTGTHPNTMRFRLLGSTSYVIVKTTFETPLMVTVSTTLGTVNPNILKLGQAADLTPKKQLCGANNYYQDSRTIEFVLNSNIDCIVTLKTQNSLYVTIRYQATVDQFFSSNGPATFIDKLASLVGVPSYNVRVVNVVVGSAIVGAHIPVDSSSTAQKYADSIINGMNDGLLDMNDMRTLDLEYIILTDSNGSTKSIKIHRQNKILYAADIAYIVIGVVVFIFAAIVGIVVYKRVKRKMNQKPVKGEWATMMSYSPQNSDRLNKDQLVSDSDQKHGEIQTNAIAEKDSGSGSGNGTPPSQINEESSPQFSIRIASRRSSNLNRPRIGTSGLNDSLGSNIEFNKRNSDEEKITESSMMAENFLKEIKQYETTQNNTESGSPLFKSLKRGPSNEKYGEPPKKSQFGQSPVIEKRFTTLKRLSETDQSKLTSDPMKTILTIKPVTQGMDVQDLESPTSP